MSDPTVEGEGLSARILDACISSAGSWDEIYLTIDGDEYQFNHGHGEAKNPDEHGDGYDVSVPLDMGEQTKTSLISRFGERADNHIMGSVFFLPFRASFDGEDHPEGPRYMDVRLDDRRVNLCNSIENMRVVSWDSKLSDTETEESDDENW